MYNFALAFVICAVVYIIGDLTEGIERPCGYPKHET